MNLIQALAQVGAWCCMGRVLTQKERTAMARQLFASDVWTAKCPKGCLPRVDFGRCPDFRVRVWCPHQSTEGKQNAEEAAQAWNAGEVSQVYALGGPAAKAATQAASQPGALEKGGLWNN